MDPVEKTVWYIEANFAAEEMNLSEITSNVGVSRFHLARAFSAITGFSIMGYVRARRLSEAAKALADGAGNILHVAIDAGYGSHEAFTRAFRNHFGVSPEEVRAKSSIADIKLVEPIQMDKSLLTTLTPPRFVDSTEMLIAGLRQRYQNETTAAIPSQWQSLEAYLGNIPAQLGKVAYGVCYNFSDGCNFDYLCGVEVENVNALPAELDYLLVPVQRYAVFTHTEHVSKIGQTWHTIFAKWFPESDLETVNAPRIERYDEKFNPVTGLGGFELWIPVQPKS